MNQLARMLADDDSAGDDARASAAEDLHESVMLLFHLRASVGREREHDDVAAEGARVKILLGQANGGNLRSGEYRARHMLELEWYHGISECVRHRNATLHRCHRGEHHDARAVASGIDGANSCA
jgi:hypothetical protein